MKLVLDTERPLTTAKPLDMATAKCYIDGMKTTLRVETPYGFTATRQTERKYSHVVVVKGQSDSYLAARNEVALKTLAGYVAKYEKFAENARRNGGTWTEIYNGGYGRKVWTVAEAERAVERQREQLENAKAAPVVNDAKPHAFAWCGRHDLAVKQAAEAEKVGYVGIVILPVAAEAAK